MMDGLLDYLLYLYSNKLLVLTMTAAEPLRGARRRLQYLVPHDPDNLNECGQTCHPVSPVYRYLNTTVPLAFPATDLGYIHMLAPCWLINLRTSLPHICLESPDDSFLNLIWTTDPPKHRRQHCRRRQRSWPSLTST